MERSDIPCQLLQSFRLPFFSILIMNPWFHSSGMAFLSKMSWIGCKMFAVWNGSVLNNFTFKLSYTWACPCFREIAEAIYGICGGSMLMFRSATGSLKLDSWFGCGLFRISLNSCLVALKMLRCFVQLNIKCTDFNTVCR